MMCLIKLFGILHHYKTIQSFIPVTTQIINAAMQIHNKLPRKSTYKSTSFTEQQILARPDQTHRSAQNFFPFIHSSVFKVSEMIKSLPRPTHPWGSFIFTQRIMGTHVLLCFCIKQAETARIWAENFLQNQYGSEVKTTPFEFALTWVSFITEVRLWDGSTWSLMDWHVLASSNGFIQEVCVVYLLSLVTVRVPGFWIGGNVWLI